MTNKKYTEEERKIYLELWRESGMSGGKFCRENNIRPTTFYNWTKKERQKQQTEKSGILQLPNLQLNMPGNNKNIILENQGWKIILPPGFYVADASVAIDLIEKKNVS